jgi:hypothetical protein
VPRRRHPYHTGENDPNPPVSPIRSGIQWIRSGGIMSVGVDERAGILLTSSTRTTLIVRNHSAPDCTLDPPNLLGSKTFSGVYAHIQEGSDRIGCWALPARPEARAPEWSKPQPVCENGQITHNLWGASSTGSWNFFRSKAANDLGKGNLCGRPCRS